MLRVGITIATAYFVQSIVQSVIDKENIAFILTDVFCVAATILFGLAVNYLSVWANGRFGEYAIRDMKNDMVKHIQDMTIEELDKSHSGDLVSRINNDTGKIREFIINWLPYLWYYPVLGISVSIYLITINWQLYLACFAILPVSIIIMKIFKDKTGVYAKNWNDLFGKSNSIAQDIIGGISIVKAFNIQSKTLAKYRGFMEKALVNGIKEDRLWLVVNGLSDIMFQVPMAVCMLLGGYMALTGHLALGAFFGFIQLIAYVIEPAASISEVLFAAAIARGSIDRMIEIKSMETERTGGESFSAVNAGPILEVRNLTFAYTEGNEILKDIGFQVKKGQTVAFVGASGSGKSTLLNIICGFYKTHHGEIRLFGKNYMDWSLENLRKHIALVSQSVYLFPGTVRENIAYGNEGASEEEIVAAAKAANAHMFILDLEEGYDTKVGERGALLSGGQRQRISIARAMLKNAPLLLLDEPTSALDAESEREIQNALATLMANRTVIVVAHKLSTIKGADEILVLQDGVVAEQGKHQELLQKEGVYYI
jgi:ABC-type multidrug transport system fused ATPase/permease subunit